MKTILALLTYSALLVAELQAGEPAKVAWMALNSPDLREHVKQVENFRDVDTLLGSPTSTDNDGTSSTARYKFKNVFTLVFVGDSRNDFRKDDDLRLVKSIYLFKNDSDGHKMIWKHFKTIAKNNSVRSDHFAKPN
jgi:hypothetical protein